MIKKLAKNIVVFSMLMFLFANFALAAGDYGLDDTVKEVSKKSINFADPQRETSIPAIVGNIVGAALSFIGVLYFGLMIYGGFLWMTARGNDEQVKKSIELITQASIGFAIVAAAYILTRFVGDTIINSLSK